MRFITCVILIILLVGCRTGSDLYYGTTGSRHGIKPYPSKEQWLNYINMISESSNNEPAILWVVGSYQSNGIKLNFPGSDDKSKKVYFSDIDLNEQYLDFFDKNNIRVFLLLEPGSADLKMAISAVLNKYSNHKSISGVCLDLEWYKIDSSNPFGLTHTVSDIENLLNHINEYNEKYKLILKHWDINKIEKYDNKNLIYLQSMEGIKSIEELIDRHKIWSRFYYPNSIGIEVGFIKDLKFWNSFKEPLKEIPLIMDKLTSEKSSFFWSESSLHQIMN